MYSYIGVATWDQSKPSTLLRPVPPKRLAKRLRASDREYDRGKQKKARKHKWPQFEVQNPFTAFLQKSWNKSKK